MPLGLAYARAAATRITGQHQPLFWTLSPDHPDLGEESGQLAACLAAVAVDWRVPNPIGYVMGSIWASGSLEVDLSLSQAIYSDPEELQRKLDGFLGSGDAQVYCIPASHEVSLNHKTASVLSVAEFRLKTEDRAYWTTVPKVLVRVKPDEIPLLATALFGRAPKHLQEDSFKIGPARSAQPAPGAAKPASISNLGTAQTIARPQTSLAGAENDLNTVPNVNGPILQEAIPSLVQNQPLLSTGGQPSRYWYLRWETYVLAVVAAVAGVAAVAAVAYYMTEPVSNGDASPTESTATKTSPEPMPRTEKGFIVRIVSFPYRSDAEASASDKVYPALSSCGDQFGLSAQLCLIQEADSKDGRAMPFKVFAVTAGGMDYGFAKMMRDCLRGTPGLLKKTDNHEILPADGRRCLLILDSNGQWLSHF
jgi:hypothetical protein